MNSIVRISRLGNSKSTPSIGARPLFAGRIAAFLFTKVDQVYRMDLPPIVSRLTPLDTTYRLDNNPNVYRMQ